ncbi:MAG: toll/interleukin-1 receptor domain-containing protein [Gammaproteobacteria bacterium]
MKIFISYSSNDKEKVTRLVRELQANNLAVWFDEDIIFPGDDLLEKMRDGINQCRYYVLCLSPSFEEKPPQSWVKHEFRIAMLKENEQMLNCIIPVRIKAGGGIPKELGGRAYADLTTTKRWSRNMPKLIAALQR